MMTSDLFDSTFFYQIQKTIKKAISFSGVGLHTGKKCEIKLLPAPKDHGIVFEKIYQGNRYPIIAHQNSVVSTQMATTVGYLEDPNIRIFTVEHLMAALYGLGLQNVTIETWGPEIPILDGSSQPFVEGILDAGFELQGATIPVLKIKKPIKVYQNGTVCELLPRESLRLTTSVDFNHPKIGLQIFALELTPKKFIEQVAKARTFGFKKDLEALKAKNLSLGATLENVLGFSELEVLNPEGLRYWDECVRHKLLDAIGDLGLCGSWIAGELVSFRGGHSIHNLLLKTLHEFPGHWEVIPSKAVPLSNYSTFFETPAVIV